MAEIDYGDLSFTEQRELDQKAYSKYYDSCFQDDAEEDNNVPIILLNVPLSFNQWFGSSYHKKYITPYLRKRKLEKIKKADF